MRTAQEIVNELEELLDIRSALLPLRFSCTTPALPWLQSAISSRIAMLVEEQERAVERQFEAERAAGIIRGQTEDGETFTLKIIR